MRISKLRHHAETCTDHTDRTRSSHRSYPDQRTAPIIPSEYQAGHTHDNLTTRRNHYPGTSYLGTVLVRSTDTYCCTMCRSFRSCRSATSKIAYLVRTGAYVMQVRDNELCGVCIHINSHLICPTCALPYFLLVLPQHREL